MRPLAIVLTLCTTSGIAAAGEPVVPADEAKTLTASEIDRYLEPYRAEIRKCYLASARGGALDLQLIIHRDGSVFQVSVLAPDVPRRVARRIDRCIRAATASWHFPVRRGFTHATVPFRFIRTVAPNAGPQRSCWRASGCRGRGRTS